MDILEYIETSEKIIGAAENRACFSCGVEMKFEDFFLLNSEKKPVESLLKIWKEKRVALECCRCYDKRYPKPIEIDNVFIFDLSRFYPKAIYAAFRFQDRQDAGSAEEFSGMP